MPPCRNPASLRMPTATASWPAVRPSSSSRPTNTTLLLAVGQPGEPRAEAGVEHRDRDRAGDVRVVELLVGAHVDDQRPVRRGAARPGAARAAGARRPSVSSGPRLSVDDRREVRRLRAELGQRLRRRTRPRRRSPASGCARARSRSWRRSSCPSRARRTSSRRGGRARPRRGRAGSSSCSCSERKMPRAPSDFSIARSGRATSSTNSVSPVSTAHGSSPRRGVDERERGVLGPVPGRVERAHAQRRRAPTRRRRRTARGRRRARRRGGCGSWRRSRPRAGRGRRRGRRGCASRSTCSIAHAHVARQREVLVDLEARVDDRRHARVLVADQVGRAAEVVVGDLAEDHRRERAETILHGRSHGDLHPHPLPAARARGRIRPRDARGRRRVRASRAAVLRRQGLDRAAAARREGVPAGAVPVPGHARRHRPQLPRGARVPRPPGRGARRAADRRLRAGLDRHGPRDRAGRLSRNRLQTVTLLDAIAEHRFDAAFGGARRDEERARAKERDLLVPRRPRAVGPARPAPGAVGPLQRRDRAGRERARVPALELDRARRLALHRRRGARAAVDLLRPRARGVRARRDALRRLRVRCSRATARRPSPSASATAPSAT